MPPVTLMFRLPSVAQHCPSSLPIRSLRRWACDSTNCPPDAAVAEVDFADQGRSRIMLKNRGKLRVYAERDSGVFIGAEMAGPAMEHIAHLLAWAVQQRLTVQQMLAMPFYHPVIEEGVRTALQRLAGEMAE